jgi:uncharacterized membrane protein YfcA
MPGFEDPTTAVYLLLALIVSAAGLVHGALGLGFPMIATPLVAMLTDVRSAILIVLAPTLAINVVNILRGGRWGQSIGRFWPLAAYAGLGSVAGSQLLVVSDPAPYKLLLAAMILLYLNVNRLGLPMAWVRAHPRRATAVFGCLGGFLAGTVNVMVPVLIIFSLELGLAPVVMIQVFNFCFLVGKLAQAAVLAHAGVLTATVVTASLPLLAIAVASLLTGMALRDRFDPETYRRWLKRVLLAIAVMLIAQFLSGR